MSASRKSANPPRKSALRSAFKPELQLAKLARSCYARGWLLGTSGNFSVVVSRAPFRLAITSTGLDKGALTADQFVRVDASGSVVHGTGKPSAETALHLVVARVRHASAVLHTHSVWSTLLSERHASERGLWIEGYEMLKGLRGVTSHQHREWLPILENHQDIPKLAREVERVMDEQPGAHGFLLQKSGRQVTDQDIGAARREGATDAEIHDTVLIAAAFCMSNRYVDGLGTWAPDDAEWYRDRGRTVAAGGYLAAVKQYLPELAGAERK